MEVSEYELEELTAKLEILLIEAKSSCIGFSPKHDNLQLEEVEIWEYTIKWGISQNPALPTNLEEWTNENFITLKISLQQFLPYIRCFQIPDVDIWTKLKHNKKILNKQLCNDLKQYLIVPDQPVKSNVLPPRTVLVQE
ncbi:hypothetical protein Glove_309g27 [Diversispora epigaea]|uniref:BACK domain-containing protein n=1 Tax=Diversispora epigaea TaxID=1348612 RepID=A0A397HS69_9GLOM|nr:hypothetical protein Glove_309g27 [Diversispora epigaea]